MFNIQEPVVNNKDFNDRLLPNSLRADVSKLYL